MMIVEQRAEWIKKIDRASDFIILLYEFCNDIDETDSVVTTKWFLKRLGWRGILN